MTMTIWKAALHPMDVQMVSVPAGAEFLCAREQHESISVWFRCDPNNAPEPRKIAIVGTGHPAPEDGRYLGSAFLKGGALIFHVFAWPK